MLTWVVPPRHRTKEYSEDGCYHVYNRGVEKRLIFQDQQDYGVVLFYLKEYLLPKDKEALMQKLGNPSTPYHEKDSILKALRLNNFSGEITLLAYCLMPNHFHFFLKQKNPNSMDKFIQSIGTRYSMYVNRKYKRVGSLYQHTSPSLARIHLARLAGTTKFVRRLLGQKKNRMGTSRRNTRLLRQSKHRRGLSKLR